MGTLAVVFLPLIIQGSPHVIQCAEPAYVEALITQPTGEALHVTVLHGSPRLDVYQVDLALQVPGQKVPTGKFWPIVAAKRWRQTAFGNDLIEHTLQAQPRKTRIHPPIAELSRV